MIPVLIFISQWSVITLAFFSLLIWAVYSGKIKGLKNLFGKIETGSYLKKRFKAKGGRLNYRILYPNGFDKAKKYPLLLFLHGAGERGKDNNKQLTHGGEFIKQGMVEHQGIVIFPQCPEGSYWIDVLDMEDRSDGILNLEPDIKNPPSKTISKVMALMNDVVKRSYVDKSRIYIAGLSMGGMGTFDLCWRMPDLFAAAIAVCGTGSPVKAFKFAHLPIRIFHGDKDQVVSVDESLEMIVALEELGGNPEAFIYPNVDHDSWDNAFAEPDFLSWLFKQKKD